MPNYDYMCLACEEQFEVFQSMDEPDLSMCPHCASATLKKIINGSGVIFKGSGFYSTDNRGFGNDTE